MDLGEPVEYDLTITGVTQQLTFEATSDISIEISQVSVGGVVASPVVTAGPSLDTQEVIMTITQLPVVTNFIIAEMGGIKGDTGDTGPEGPAGIDQMIYNEVPSGTVNGVNQVFNTLFSYVSGTTRLYINGLRQKVAVSYNESGSSQITLSEAPLSGDILIIDYIKD